MSKEDSRPPPPAASPPEAFYHALFESAADAMAVVDPESGAILEANQRMVEMFGYSREDARSLEFWALGSSQAAGGIDGLHRLARLAARGEPQLFEWEVQDSSGMRFGAEVHLKAAVLGGKERLLAVIRDITGRQRVRQALKESEDRFRVVTEGSLAGVFLLQGGRLIYANPMLAQIFGYPTEELTRLATLEDLIAPRDRSLVAENIRRLLSGELAWARQSFQGQRRDGTMVHLEGLARRADYRGRPAVIGTLLNVTARWQAEEALRKSERRYRAIVEDQTELVTRFLPDGTITFVNEANCRYFGKSQEDLVGRSFLPVIPEEDRERVQRQIFSLTPENPIVTLEHRVFRPDGQVAWQQWTNRALFDEDGRVREYQAVGRDITERKAMEEALRETRDHLQTLIQASPLAIIALDRDFRVRIWNTAAAEIFGWTPEECLGRLLPPIPADEWPGGRLAQPEAWSGGLPEPRELRCLRKDGSSVDLNLWVAALRDADGGMAGELWILADITQRKQAEAALRDSEEKYRALLDHAGDAIFLADTSGVIIEVNRKAQELMGYSEEELLGLHFSQLHPAKQLGQVTQKFGEILGKGMASVHSSLVLRRDGTEVPVDISGRIVEYGGRKVVQGIFRDITEHLRIQQALARSERQLRDLTSQLLTAQERERRRLSRELHDELGQALTALKIHLVAVGDRLQPGQQGLKEECEHLLSHIDDTIENVRRLAWDLSPSILEDLGLASALKYLLEETCRHHNLKYSLTMDDIGHLFSLEAQINIYRIFQETLTNIVRHAEASRVEVTAIRQKDRVTLAVADDGAGFDVKDTMSRRASSKKMGLTTMMERARMAGGSLAIRSRRSRGTRVTLALPLR